MEYYIQLASGRMGNAEHRRPNAASKRFVKCTRSNRQSNESQQLEPMSIINLNESTTPHGKVFVGTLANSAIQCECPDTGKTGCFLFTTASHRNKGTRCSPIFDDLADLFVWCRVNQWEPLEKGFRFAGNPNANTTQAFPKGRW